MIDESGVPFCTMAVAPFAPDVNPLRTFAKSPPLTDIAPESENQLWFAAGAVLIGEDGTIECREVTLFISPPSLTKSLNGAQFFLDPRLLSSACQGGYLGRSERVKAAHQVGEGVEVEGLFCVGS